MKINAIQEKDLFIEREPHLFSDLAVIQLDGPETDESRDITSWPTFDWISTLEDVVRNGPKDYAPIIARQKEILEIREFFRQFIESGKPFRFFYERLASSSANILENGTYQVQDLFPVGEGISGTYFWLDRNGEPQFVIKPFDEEAGCINNPKSFEGISNDNPVRDYIPLYHSAMREALAYRVAQIVGVDSIVPETALAIIQASQFHDFSEKVPRDRIAQYLEECGPIDREKLCSVQEYVQDSQPIWEAIWDMESMNLSDEEIAARFDQKDFEDANILIWTTYDTDAHMGNLLVYPKEDGVLGIKKIDNGLAFPDKNRQLRNHLVYLENAERPLSDEGRAKIARIDVEALAEQFKIYGLESAIPALRERIAFLKEISAKPGMTIKDIDKAMSKVGMYEFDTSNVDSEYMCD